MQVDVSNYSGERNAEGKPHGVGTCTWAKESGFKFRSYEGRWENGVMHGMGKAISHSQTHYEGIFDNGVLNGRGVCNMQDGSRYEGEFRSNNRQGRGYFKWVSGASYEGNWERNNQNGRGYFVAAENRSTYDGEWLNNEKHGRGLLVHNVHGWTYDGEFRNSRKEGRGVFKGGGTTYDGDWVADEKHGRGTFTGKDHTYVGNYYHEKRHGRGEYKWHKSGATYVGEWDMGVQNGHGKFTSKDDGGWTYDGEWKNNLKWGRGLFVTPHYEFDGQYVNDKRNGPGRYKSKTTIYDGEWKDDKKHGRGRQENLQDHTTYEGEFANHEKHGRGIVKDRNGTVLFDGVYQKGVQVANNNNLGVGGYQEQRVVTDGYDPTHTGNRIPSREVTTAQAGREVSDLSRIPTSGRQDSRWPDPNAFQGESEVGSSMAPGMMDSIQRGEANEGTRFEVDKSKKLGEGGYGAVYQAWDHVGGTHIAVKEVKPKSTGGSISAQEVAELQHEFNLIKKLRHKHIVPVYGMKHVPQQNFCQIYMKFMPTGSIQKILKDNKFRLHESNIRNYTRGILEGLAFLYENKVVHRDIKPANVLIDQDGYAALSDFGTSKVTENPTQNEQDFEVGVTVPFLSPEACRANFTVYSDMWAVGCTIVDMATGKRPWHQLPKNQQTRNAMLYHICNLKESDACRHPMIPDHLSPQLRSLLQRMFSLDPRSRGLPQDYCQEPYFKSDRQFKEWQQAGMVESLQDYKLAKQRHVEALAAQQEAQLAGPGSPAIPTPHQVPPAEPKVPPSMTRGSTGQNVPPSGPIGGTSASGPSSAGPGSHMMAGSSLGGEFAPGRSYVTGGEIDLGLGDSVPASHGMTTNQDPTSNTAQNNNPQSAQVATGMFADDACATGAYGNVVDTGGAAEAEPQPDMFEPMSETGGLPTSTGAGIGWDASYDPYAADQRTQ